MTHAEKSRIIATASRARAVYIRGILASMFQLNLFTAKLRHQ